jgi:hypothetical protein
MSDVDELVAAGRLGDQNDAADSKLSGLKRLRSQI